MILQRPVAEAAGGCFSKDFSVEHMPSGALWLEPLRAGVIGMRMYHAVCECALLLILETEGSHLRNQHSQLEMP